MSVYRLQYQECVVYLITANQSELEEGVEFKNSPRKRLQEEDDGGYDEAGEPNDSAQEVEILIIIVLWIVRENIKFLSK